MRWIVVATLLSAACSKKSADGLPPAQEWSANASGQMQPGGGAMAELPPASPPPGMGAGMQNPQGRAEGDDPHAGLGIPPVNGMGGGGPGAGDDPHAGLGIDPSGSGGG